MRRALLGILTVVLIFALACGGGGDDDDDGGNGDGGGSSPSASSDSNGGSSGGSGGGSGGGSDDFCSPDEADEIFSRLNFAGVSSETLEEQANRVREGLDAWADRAPGEIRDDVEVLAEVIGGLYELFEEYDFNFLSMSEDVFEDSRFVALESSRFEDAVANIEAYCGFDLDRPDVSGSGSTGGTDGGGGGGFTPAGLPDTFPEEFVPPDSMVISAADIGAGVAGTFQSTATFAAVREHYEDLLGDPNQIDSQNLVWTVAENNQVTAVTVSGTDGAVFIGVSITRN